MKDAAEELTKVFVVTTVVVAVDDSLVAIVAEVVVL